MIANKLKMELSDFAALYYLQIYSSHYFKQNGLPCARQGVYNVFCHNRKLKEFRLRFPPFAFGKKTLGHDIHILTFSWNAYIFHEDLNMSVYRSFTSKPLYYYFRVVMFSVTILK